MAKRYTFEGKEGEYVKLEDHTADLERTRSSATKGFVEKSSEEFTALENDANTYREQEFDKSLFNTDEKNMGAFAKYNVNKEYSKEIKSLAGIERGMKPEEIDKKITEFKAVPKNEIYFVKGNSGGVGSNPHGATNIKNPASAPLRTGGGISRLFNKKK